MAITVKVSEWGNSLAIRLPKAVVDQLGLKAGGEAELELYGLAATIKNPAVEAMRKRHENMADEARAILAAGGHAPDLVEWGPDVGAEILPAEEWVEIDGRLVGRPIDD